MTQHKEGNHQPRPPGNPMLKGNDAEHEKERQKELAHTEVRKTGQTDTVQQHTLPIKQPNKATNNS
ncbi:hypothetical protein GCM10007205_19460 [Oxalicibacterium flavum]|uniref:Uncharacterized protein n=1 Tax=Oxalicibacterium flavum TaxID=179467 RepID=A0A8J2UL62_9BURK|nr:hypothetical protein [Oxalicibacterium flavum]GGC10441.1 hypothetical protein GCM10007205_19460 [Oxalicibacterium flavum]